jgi:hypothetical protein
VFRPRPTEAGFAWQRLAKRLDARSARRRGAIE